MKKNRTPLFFLLMVISTLFFLHNAQAAEYRIGYLEAGPFFTYSETYKVLRSELETMGWGDKISFPEDAHFSPGWDPVAKKEILPKKAAELMARSDLDLIIAAGTSGNREILKANNGKTPILGMCVSDAVKAGFVPSGKDSGIDNYTVRIVPDRYKRMFQLFQEVVPFKKLGLMYSEADKGSRNSVANADDAHQVAKLKGFKIIEQKVANNNDEDLCFDGIKALVDNGMDAFFIPSLSCFDWKLSNVEKLYNLLNDNKIPTFARSGSKDVKAGALMGFTTIDFSHRGKVHTEKLVKILQGTKPRDLPMEDEFLPKLSLNLSTAKQIGFDLPLDVIGSSDEIFQKVTLPDDRKAQ